MKKLEKFETIMDGLARRHGIHQVFSDLLTLLICAFSHGRMEKQYFETIRKYEKPYAYSFSEALAALVIEMTGPEATGLIDILGKYYQENVSHGRNGQFFSPEPVCDLIARFNLPDKPGSRILDPACGSGRMLLAAAKYNRTAWFYGADVDASCAKMTAINLCLNGLFGEVAWMDSLSNEFHAAWEIRPTIHGIPYLVKIPSFQSFIYMRVPEEKKNTHTISHTQQQLIFEL